MELFGATHISLLLASAALAVGLSLLLRARPHVAPAARQLLGWGLIVNESIWYAFRYTQEGIHASNLPLQLCDVTLWGTALACLMPQRRLIVEFAYYAGVSGAAAALVGPDLWSPWPSYPAIYFFLAHGGIVVGAAMLVWGGVVGLQRGSAWRAFGMVAVYAIVAGVFNAIFGTNYMYLSHKPATASPLDAMGPWPVYILAGAALTVAVFWILWILARFSRKPGRY